MVTLESLRATLEALPARGGTMRAWIQAHNGKRVDTLQASHSGRNIWAPLGRTVDAMSHAGRVSLLTEDGASARYYAGCRVIGSSATVLAVTSDDALIIYRVSGE